MPQRYRVFRGACGHRRHHRTQHHYLWIFIFLGLANAAFVPVNLFAIYAAKSYGLTMDAYGKYLVVTFICSFFLAFPLGWLADRFHPLRVGLVALLLYAALMLTGFR